MTHTTNASDLPVGMVLVETAAGRWFPACAPQENPPRFLHIVQGSADIPPAFEPHDNPEQGYSSREEAIQAYLSWREAAVLPVRWRILAARTELFPERNAWYLDEIAHLTGDDRPLLSCGASVYAVVMADWCDTNEATVDATGDTIDEAIEELYQRVSAWWYGHQHTTQKRAS